MTETEMIVLMRPMLLHTRSTRTRIRLVGG